MIQKEIFSISSAVEACLQDLKGTLETLPPDHARYLIAKLIREDQPAAAYAHV